LFICITLHAALRCGAQEPIEGYAVYTHDPSTLIKQDNRYYYFGTSQDLVYHWSTDLRNWNNHGYVFPSGPPAWTTQAVPAFTGHFWAPDVAYFNGRYHVYYSVSEWGTIDSAIGLVTTPSLISPTWTDRGKVVQSDASDEQVPETDTTEYNCIDPAILVDTDGSVWMTFGSYSSGILVTEIDPATGLRMDTDSLVATQVANNTPGSGRGWGSTIEGAPTRPAKESAVGHRT
jgi:arabinan endo-1,5-alpha-L-arabinosidase